jgi:acyl-CoA thioesterase FadM
MKHDAWRRQLDAYPFSAPILPRYTDVDLWQHLNNVALVSLEIESVQRLMLDVAGDAAWRAGTAERPALGPEATSTDFIAEAYYPTPLTAAARITHVNERDVGIASALFQNGHCVGLHQSRIVAWADGLPVPVPADTRAAFAARMAAQAPLPPGGEPEAGHKPALVHPGPGGAPADDMQALPHAAAGFPSSFTLEARFGDHDAASRASDQALARMAEQGRVNMLTALMGPHRLESPIGFMVAHVSLRWLKRGAAPQAWTVGSGVLRSGSRSITIRAQLYDGDGSGNGAGNCVALCDSVMVAIDRDLRRSVDLPAELRAKVDAQSIR